MSSKHGDKNKSIMYRLLLLFITSLLISFSGFAQQTQSDSLQEVRKAQIEKARAAARAKAEARAAERAKMESEKQKTDKSTATLEKSDKKKAEADSKKVEAKADNANEKESKRERKAREKKADDAKGSKATATKEEPKKEEKPKKPSIKERNMADTTVAKSKYGDGTFGLRGSVGASIAWSDYSDRNNKIGFNSWGFVLNGGIGYRINHVAYAGITFDIEAIELLAFSPMLDIIVTAPTPVAPFVEMTAGPYFSYDEYRKWVFQPRAGLSYRGKKNKIMRFGFGLRMYDDAFDAETFKPQYAASVTAEF